MFTNGTAFGRFSGSQDYADAASHVSEEAQKEAKVPTNSRYFLHDDRRVNEEETEEKENGFVFFVFSVGGWIFW